MITQCPKCQTSFRVTEAQLAIASGSVRCGSCLHIFSATSHRFDDTATSQNEQNLETVDHAISKPEIFTKENSEVSITDEVVEQEHEIPSNNDSSDSISSDSVSSDSVSSGSVSSGNILSDGVSIGQVSDSDISSDNNLTSKLLSNTIEQKAFNSIFEDDLQNTEDFESQDPLISSPGSAENSSDGSNIDDNDINKTDNIDNDFSNDSLPEALNTEENEDYIEASFDGIDDEFGIDDLTSDLESNPRDDLLIDGMIDDDFGLEEGEDKQSITDTNYSEGFLDLDHSENEKSNVYKELNDATVSDNKGDEQWALDLMEEADHEEETASEEIHQDLFEELDEETRLDPELLDILNQRDQLADSPPITEDEIVLGNEPMIAGDRIGANSDQNITDNIAQNIIAQSNKDFIANIEPEPVVIAAASNPKHLIKRAWQFSILLALLTLVGQYLYFNINNFSRNSDTRPLLIKACGILGCKIPNLNDVTQIRSTNLMVRSHPNTPNALVVDAIITNRANFEQSFPDIELLFTDINGKSVARRSFTSPEYIHGELTGTKIMPVKQPVYISFEIVDPGQIAVNYQLLIHAN